MNLIAAGGPLRDQAPPPRYTVDVWGAIINLRAPGPITRGLTLEALALLALAVLVGIFVHSIVPLLVMD